jgi:hypothetical protein
LTNAPVTSSDVRPMAFECRALEGGVLTIPYKRSGVILTGASGIHQLHVLSDALYLERMKTISSRPIKVRVNHSDADRWVVGIRCAGREGGGSGPQPNSTMLRRHSGSVCVLTHLAAYPQTRECPSRVVTHIHVLPAAQ